MRREWCEFKSVSVRGGQCSLEGRRSARSASKPVGWEARLDAALGEAQGQHWRAKCFAFHLFVFMFLFFFFPVWNQFAEGWDIIINAAWEPPTNLQLHL